MYYLDTDQDGFLSINPERIKDSRNAKNNTNNHAYSALVFKYNSIFSNIGY